MVLLPEFNIEVSTLTQVTIRIKIYVNNAKYTDVYIYIYITD